MSFNSSEVRLRESEELLPATGYIPEKAHVQRRSFTARKVIAFAAAIVVIVLAVVLPVYFVVIRKHNTNSSSSSGSGSGSGSSSSGGSSKSNAKTGGDGSTVTLANGTTFIYNNSFGGYWVEDPDNPWNNDARPNSWTPPLNTSWTWGVDRVYGVNLGGLFVLEPFITPGIFQQYPTAIDEYSLSVLMRADTNSSGINQIEDHYNTFITEQDIAEIAGAGLNWLRVPIPFWAIETWEGEPYLAKTSWTYFLRIVGWARKYGLRIVLDLHALPGSQNGLNHSGRLSPVNMLAGNMGLANAERSIYYIRVLTEFISQPEYRDVIPVFGIVNEPMVGIIGLSQITSFYLDTYTMIRNITGHGAGDGPFIAIHDGFLALNTWYGFLAGSDRIMLDTHPYVAFSAVDESPIAINGATGQPGGKWPLVACNNWGVSTNESRMNFGVTIAGEFSSAVNDCGTFLRGVNATTTNTQCPEYVDWKNYNDSMKAGIMNWGMASMDAFGDWFFWTWKIGPAADGEIESPTWSYQLGYRNGWMPRDPRTASGLCDSLGASNATFNGTFAAWQTGASTSTIAASSTASYPWPPTSISGAVVPVSLMPTYTDTATIITLPPATFTSAPASLTSSVDGWFDPQDTQSGITAVAGCTYPDEYNGIFTVTPTAPCTGPTS